MRRYILILVAVCLAGVSVASQPYKDLTQKPDPIELSFEPQLGEFKTFVADNGVTVFIIRKEGYPKSRFNFTFRLPPFDVQTEPEAYALVGDLMKLGDGKRATSEMSDLATDLGGDYFASASGYTIAGLKGDIGGIMDLFGSSLRYTNYKSSDFEKYRAEQIEKIKNKKPVKTSEKSEWQQLKDSLTFYKLTRESVKPTIEGFENLTLKEVRDYRKKYYGSNNCYCIITGDYTEDEINALFKKHLSGWSKGERYDAPEQASDQELNYSPTHTRIYVKDNPIAVQSSISIQWALGDLYPYGEKSELIEMLSTIFGDNYNSYLTRNLRLDKGLCYFVRGSLSPNGTGGEASAFTKVGNAVTGYALENMFLEMFRIRNYDVSEEDFNMIKNGLLGNHAMTLSSLNSPIVIGFGMVKEDYNLPDSYLHDFPKRLNEVTIEQVREAAQEYIKPYESVVYIEGNVKEIKDQLEKFGNVEYFDEDGKRMSVN